MVDDPAAWSASSQRWSCTKGGWIWYCDVHDTHGNADLEEEAYFVARTHAEFTNDPDGCDLYVVPIEPPAR